LLKGLYCTIRDPLAHDPKVEGTMTEQDALDILTMNTRLQATFGWALHADFGGSIDESSQRPFAVVQVV